MGKFIGKSNERILCKLSKSEILRLFSIVHVAMETTKTNFTCHSKSFINIFFTCQVSACELQPFSCHDLANGIYYQTTKTVFNHLNCLQKKKYWNFLRFELKKEEPYVSQIFLKLWLISNRTEWLNKSDFRYVVVRFC